MLTKIRFSLSTPRQSDCPKTSVYNKHPAHLYGRLREGAPPRGLLLGSPDGAVATNDDCEDGSRRSEGLVIPSARPTGVVCFPAQVIFAGIRGRETAIAQLLQRVRDRVDIPDLAPLLFFPIFLGSVCLPAGAPSEALQRGSEALLAARRSNSCRRSNIYQDVILSRIVSEGAAAGKRQSVSFLKD